MIKTATDKPAVFFASNRCQSTIGKHLSALAPKANMPIVSSASPSGPGRVQAPSDTVVSPVWTLKYAASPLNGQYVRGDVDGSRQPGVTSAMGMQFLGGMLVSKSLIARRVSATACPPT